MRLLRRPGHLLKRLPSEEKHRDVRRAARLALADPDAVLEAAQSMDHLVRLVENGDVFKWFVEDAMMKKAASRQTARPRNLP